MEELERHLKEEMRLREKAEKRLKFLMKKLESIKRSRRIEGSEQLSSSEASCLSSVSTSASKEGEEEEEEIQGNRAVEEEKTNHATENVVSMEQKSSLKLKDVASISSHEEESQSCNDLSWCSDAT